MDDLFKFIKQQGKDWREINDALGLGREIFIKLNLRIITDVPPKLTHWLAAALGIEAEALAAYFQLPLKQPVSTGHYPCRSQEWREAIETSCNMSDEDKARWLTGEASK